MNAIIIGCGYVGRAIAPVWQQAGLTVTGTTLSIDRVPALQNYVNQAVVLRGTDADTMRNLLAHQDVLLLSIGSRGADTYEQTYLGTAKTLATVLPQTPRVQQIIYTSTCSVYGDRQGELVTEAMSVAPATRNSEILAEAEQILLCAAQAQLKVCVFRLGGIYGPGRELARIFGRSAGTTRPGSGAEPSNWVHLEDIVRAIEFARVQQLDGIYNLVQDGTVSIRELIGQVCQRNHLPQVIWDASQPSTRAYNARVSNQKLQATGFQFVHSVIQD